MVKGSLKRRKQLSLSLSFPLLPLMRMFYAAMPCSQEAQVVSPSKRAGPQRRAICVSALPGSQSTPQPQPRGPRVLRATTCTVPMITQYHRWRQCL